MEQKCFNRLPRVSAEFRFDGYHVFKWRQYVLRTLKGNRMKHLIEAPPNRSDPSYDHWFEEERALRKWILLRMSHIICDDFVNFQTVKEIWEAANAMRNLFRADAHIYYLFSTAISTSQGEQTLREYAMELKELFQEIDYFRPQDPTSIERRHVLEDRVFMFLAGVRPELAYLRGQILGQQSPEVLNCLIDKAIGIQPVSDSSSSYRFCAAPNIGGSEHISVVFELLELMLGSSP